MIKKFQEYLSKAKDVAAENESLSPADVLPLQLNGSFQRVAFFTFFALTAVGALYVIGSYWQLIYVAAVTAFLMHPLFTVLLTRSKFKPAVVTGLILLILLLLVFIPLFIGLMILGNEAAQLGRFLSSPESLDLGQLVAQIDAWLAAQFDIKLEAILNQLWTRLGQNIGAIFSAIAGAVGNVTSSVMDLFFYVVMFGFLFVVMLNNWEKMRAMSLSLSPLNPTVTRRYISQTANITRGVVVGLFGVSVIETVILWVTLSLLGIPFAGTLSSIGFVLSLIPVVGMSLMTIPLGIVLILFGQWLPALIIWAVHFFIINNVDLMLRPLIMPKELGVPLALIVLGFVGGLPAFGPIGLFVGPLLVAWLVTSVEIYLDNYGPLAPEPQVNES